MNLRVRVLGCSSSARPFQRFFNDHLLRLGWMCFCFTCHNQILGKLSLPIFAQKFITSHINQKTDMTIYYIRKSLRSTTGTRLCHWTHMEGVGWMVSTLGTVHHRMMSQVTVLTTQNIMIHQYMMHLQLFLQYLPRLKLPICLF